MSYAIENLGSAGFEQVSTALLCAEYGADVRVFSEGRDDGRDATFHGSTFEVTGQSGSSSWTGYHVFQAKYRGRTSGTQSNFSWLKKQITDELRRWTERDDNNRLKRKGPRPEYYIFITNVTLSGQHEGQIEELKKTIRAWAAADDSDWPLRDCDIWDLRKFESLLDGNEDVRHRFAGMLTTGDVLARIMEGLDLAPGLTRTESGAIADEYTRSGLASRDMLALAEAGDRTNRQLELATVAVDLPAMDTDTPGESTRVEVLRHIIELGNRCHSPSILQSASPHLLLLGGPGQGKTTLGRILVQNYRAALLRGHERLSTDVQRTVDAVTRRANELDLPEVTNKRWPFRIDLAQYAATVAGGDEVPLIKFIAKEVEKVTGARTNADTIRKWLRSWPWLLILDGYDEVTAATSREQVASALTSLLQTIETTDADVLLIATTRPQGYGDELPSSLRKLTLQELEPRDAVAYARQVTKERLLAADRVEEIIARIEEALRLEVTARLMRTPLQVMIMSLLLEFQQQIPNDRATLFESYYETIYGREVQKPGSLASLLSEHQRDVLAIHMRAGLSLQIRAQNGHESDATMRTDELRSLIRARLESQEYSGVQLEHLVDNLTRASNDRLVLLSATGRNSVRFDLRSLQEFMAAKQLTTALDDVVTKNLTAISKSAHWRNTWLLAMGVLRKDREELFTEIVQQLPLLDGDDWIGLLNPLGPELAIDLLNDGMTAGAPRETRILAEIALGALRHYAEASAGLGAALASIESPSELIKAKIVSSLKQALNGTLRERAVAKSVLKALAAAPHTGPLATRARQLSSSAQAAEDFSVTDRMASLQQVQKVMRKIGRIGDPGSLAHTFFAELAKRKLGRKETQAKFVFFVPSVTSNLIHDQDSMQVVVEAIMDLDEEHWPVKATLARTLYVARSRAPVPLLEESQTP